MADYHHPLSRMFDYFRYVDIDSLFRVEIDRKKLAEDHFDGFLDLMQNVGCSEVLSDIAVNSFKRYGFKVTNLNFDATSKVRLGEYELQKVLKALYITFEYSK